MKNYFKGAYLLVLLMCLGYSCNDDELITEPSVIEEKGRFDNEPFKWDYESPSTNEPDQIYIGDLFASPLDVEVVPVFSANTSKKSTYSNSSRHIESSSEESSKRGNYTTDNKKDVENPYREEDLFVENPVGIYVGAAYPAKSFSTSFQNEFLHPRNPQEFTFEFALEPFFYDTNRETGSRGYKMGYKEAMKSEEYKQHIKSGKSENLDYKYSRFDSYSDVEKAFGANAKLGAFFAAQVKRNSKRTNIKGRLLAQVISKNFSVYMEMANPAKGFFKDAAHNKINPNTPITDQAVYLRSLTYGKIAYVAIESEYSYDEVKLAIETSFKIGFIKGNASYDKHTLDIFSKSDITVYVVSSDAGDAKFYDSAESIKTVFSVPYGIGSHGLPIYCQGRYVHNHNAFYLEDLMENNSSRTDKVTTKESSSRGSGGNSSVRTGSRESSRSSRRN